MSPPSTDCHPHKNASLMVILAEGTIAMKKVLLVFLSIALFSGSSAYAGRVKLVKSTPENGSISDGPPSAFVLEFTEAVTLHQVYIKKDNEKETALSNLAHNDVKTVTIPAPSLAGGHYVLEWSVFTHDSVVLSGRIRFTVSGASVAARSSTQ
jgi:methionine-rich copper-binding protein CopC